MRRENKALGPMKRDPIRAPLTWSRDSLPEQAEFLVPPDSAPPKLGSKSHNNRLPPSFTLRG